MGDHMAIYDVFGNQITQPYDINGNELTNAYDIQGNLIWEKEASKDPYIAGRTLIWEDDFDGSSLDLSKWGYELGDVRTNEIQTYRENNVSVENSCLVLTAKKEDFGTKHWTSGSILGQRKQSFLYGRIEAKVKAQNIEGAFPAFWMMGSSYAVDYHETGTPTHADDAKANWPKCGEIDIFEYTSQNRTRAKGTLFSYTGTFVGGRQYLSDLVNSEEWNIYSCEWTEDYIKLYLNDVCFATWNLADYDPSAIQAYSLPHFILFDLAVGSYGGTPAESTIEMKMYVDWVRVYAPLQSDGYRSNTFSILGDSYSTYEGYTVHPWYPSNGDLTSVNQTWWKLFESQTNIQLLTNESYSGSCICYDGYGGGTSDQGDSGISFLGRMKKLMYSQYIFIFGGTNDSWVPVNIGEYKYSDWTETDKQYFRPALACLIDYVKGKYPKSTVIFIKNTELGSSFNTSIDTICNHYNVPVVALSNIDKGTGHPTVTGMQQIATQVINALGL